MEYDSSPVLSNLNIRNNNAEDNGGGICIHSEGGKASPVLTNVTIINNVSGRWGGALCINGKTSKPKLENVNITGNKAIEGGGFACIAEEFDCSPELENVLISGNKANKSGGVYIFAMAAKACPILINTTICGNNAFSGDIDDYGVGGMFIISTGEARPYLKNSVIWGNKSIIEEINNFYLYGRGGNNPVYTYSLVEGMDLGATNLSGNTDPKFVNHVNADFAPTVSGMGDYRLSEISPLINKGNNSDVNLLYDLDGQNRIYGDIVDIGAFELQRDPDISNNDAMSVVKSIWSYQGSLYVKTINNATTISVYSINGMMVKQINNIGEGTHTITLPEGFYIVKLSTGETKKIIIRNK